jgi:hypothetical protein
VYIDSSRGFCLGNSDIYISCFTHINSSQNYLHFFYCPAPQLFNSLQCIALYYLHAQVKCFNIFHSLTFSFLSYFPIIPSDRALKYRFSKYDLLNFIDICYSIPNLTSDFINSGLLLSSFSWFD